MPDSLPNCEYHVDAKSNRTVLQRLDSASSYLVYTKMCNKENLCSPDGKPYIIKELQGESQECVCVCVGGGGGEWSGLSSCYLKRMTIEFCTCK